jgi:hypothetical protein
VLAFIVHSYVKQCGCAVLDKTHQGPGMVILVQKSFKECASASSGFESANQHLPRHQQSPPLPSFNYTVPAAVPYSLLQQKHTSLEYSNDGNFRTCGYLGADQIFCTRMASAAFNDAFCCKHLKMVTVGCLWLVVEWC